MSPFKLVFLAVCLVALAQTFVCADQSSQVDFCNNAKGEFCELEVKDFEVETLNNAGSEDRADRHRRVTCDLLSFGGQVNHSACAAHCLARGKAGGSCKDGVCLCRKTKFTDLFGHK